VHTDHYWFVGFEDGSFKFFNEEDPLTEEEFRKRAPAEQLALLDQAKENQRMNKGQ